MKKIDSESLSDKTLHEPINEDVLLPRKTLDIAHKAYENSQEGLYLLARTFRGGSSNGVESELAYLENTPGYIFCNPTTVINRTIPSKTISQLPGNDWSGQPSLLFTIQSQEPATIAYHGLASLNSFSSTDAISIMMRFNKLDKIPDKKLTLSQKLDNLGEFLNKHWTMIIDELRKTLDQLENKPITNPKQRPTKTFYKPFDLLFHSTSEYNELIRSLETLSQMLTKAYALDNVLTDVELTPHPVANIIHDIQFQTENTLKPSAKKILKYTSDIQFNTSTTLKDQLKKYNSSTLSTHSNDTTRNKESNIENVQRIKSAIIRAAGSYKTHMTEKELNKENKSSNFIDESLKNPKDSRKKMLEQEALIYDNYSNYLDTGARHNELVSRVYPWEISGIEWGQDDSTKLNAISDLIIVSQRKIALHQEFIKQGIEHPLFTDFIINKLSFRFTDASYEALVQMLDECKAQGTQHPMYYELISTLEAIKLQLANPVFIYEYSPTDRRLINISSIITHYRNQPRSTVTKVSDALIEDNSGIKFEHTLAIKYNELFEQGIRAYEEKRAGQIIVAPPSATKQINVRINDPKLSQFRQFWLDDINSQATFLNVLQQLGDTIINQPYVDEQRELLDSKKRIVYRPNHDVTHAIRRLSYTKHLYNILLATKQEPWATTIKQLTSEEIACIDLVMYLLRAGRTNEKGSREDSTHAARTANIFQLVTEQLGFNQNLIDSVKHAILTHPTQFPKLHLISSGYSGETQEQKNNKAYLICIMADLSHNIDLVRCNSWKRYFATEEELDLAQQQDPNIKSFAFKIRNYLKNLFGSDSLLIDQITTELLLLAKKSCEITGTPVFYEGFASSEKVSSYDEPINDQSLLYLVPSDLLTQDPSLPASVLLKDIKYYWTHNVSEAYLLLTKPSNLLDDSITYGSSKVTLETSDTESKDTESTDTEGTDTEGTDTESTDTESRRIIF